MFDIKDVSINLNLTAAITRDAIVQFLRKYNIPHQPCYPVDENYNCYCIAAGHFFLECGSLHLQTDNNLYCEVDDYHTTAIARYMRQMKVDIDLVVDYADYGPIPIINALYYHLGDAYDRYNIDDVYGLDNILYRECRWNVIYHGNMLFFRFMEFGKHQPKTMEQGACHARWR